MISDCPGVSASESPPIQTRRRCSGLNACFGAAVAVGADGVVVVGLGRVRSTSSSPLRPARSWIPRRSRSRCRKWLRSYSGSAKKRAMSRFQPTGCPSAVLRMPGAFSNAPNNRHTRPTMMTCPAAIVRRGGSPVRVAARRWARVLLLGGVESGVGGVAVVVIGQNLK